MVTLILLMAVGTFAQQPLKSAQEKDVCDWRSDRTLTTTSEKTHRSDNAHVNLLHTESRPEKTRCDYFALALPARATQQNLDGGLRVVQPFTLRSFDIKSVRQPKFALNPLFVTTPAQGQPDKAAEAEELAKKLSNPVASLISFPLQSNFDFGMGTGSGWRYTLNVQPVIPIKLNDKWNLISRTIIPIIHQSNVTGPGTSESGLGDTTQSFFFSPSKSEPFIWAVGPVLFIPTASDSKLGTQKFGLGPTALVLKQKEAWTYGILANHIWSVAGKSSRSDVNSTFLQPFLSYTNKQAWTYTINTESTYDWVSNSWSVPIIPQISKLVRFGKQPVSFGGGLKCWVTSPEGGPENCSIRIIVTALFPKK